LLFSLAVSSLSNWPRRVRGLFFGFPVIRDARLAAGGALPQYA